MFLALFFSKKVWHSHDRGFIFAQVSIQNQLSTARILSLHTLKQKLLFKSKSVPLHCRFWSLLALTHLVSYLLPQVLQLMHTRCWKRLSLFLGVLVKGLLILPLAPLRKWQNILITLILMMSFLRGEVDQFQALIWPWCKVFVKMNQRLCPLGMNWGSQPQEISWRALRWD